MKKIAVLVLALAILSLSLIACNTRPAQFTGEWKFSKIVKVEILPEAMEEYLDSLKEQYNADDVQGIEANALAAFTADGIFAPCNIKFGDRLSYAYSPEMDREATWAFYQTGDNEGFLSIYSELNPADGNPDPLTNPPLVYDAESNTILITLKYIGFKVTVELTR